LFLFLAPIALLELGPPAALKGATEYGYEMILGCRKSQNPLTAKIAKILRKGRKEFKINTLSLLA
jgi:hypothetical protein